MYALDSINWDKVCAMLDRPIKVFKGDNALALEAVYLRDIYEPDVWGDVLSLFLLFHAICSIGGGVVLFRGSLVVIFPTATGQQ